MTVRRAGLVGLMRLTTFASDKFRLVKENKPKKLTTMPPKRKAAGGGRGQAKKVATETPVDVKEEAVGEVEQRHEQEAESRAAAADSDVKNADGPGANGQANDASAFEKIVADGSLAKDESDHVRVRCLVSSGTEVDQEQIKASLPEVTLVTIKAPTEPTEGSVEVVEKVVYLEGRLRSVAAAVLTKLYSQVRVRLVVSENGLTLDRDAKSRELNGIGNEHDISVSVSALPLPMSNDRTITIRGVVDDGSKAQKILEGVQKVIQKAHDLEQTPESFPHIEYIPRPIAGLYGHPDTFRRQAINNQLAELNPYTADHPEPNPEGTYALPSGPSAGVGGGGAAAGDPNNDTPLLDSQEGLEAAQQQARMQPINKTFSQSVLVPHDMVGSIIGKGGVKVNEIRQMSGSTIKINDSDRGVAVNRTITVTGTPEGNQMALMLMYQRIESERQIQIAHGRVRRD